MGIKNKLPVLICDLDDVLNDLVQKWLKLYNQTYNDNLKFEDIKGWDIGNYTKIGNEMYQLLETPSFFKNLDIQPDCYNVLKEFQEYFDIQIVSASSYKTYADKAEWVQEHLDFLPIRSLNAVTSKYIIKGSIILDDNYENIKDFDGIRLLFSKPWNEHIKGDFQRVHNWLEVKSVLQDFLKGENDWNKSKQTPISLSEFIKRTSKERVRKNS